jgi:hypothetical protein
MPECIQAQGDELRNVSGVLTAQDQALNSFSDGLRKKAPM